METIKLYNYNDYKAKTIKVEDNLLGFVIRRYENGFKQWCRYKYDE